MTLLSVWTMDMMLIDPLQDATCLHLRCLSNFYT